MALRKIMKEGDPCLHRPARAVTRFDRRLHTLLDDMADTLLDANGVGLAAPQVGIGRRVFIVDTGEDGILEMVNPEILETSGEQDGMEGCLSVPGRWGMVKRAEYVKARAQNRDGEWFEVEADELVARCILHENDHLDGHLFTERAYRWLSQEELEAMYPDEEEPEE